MAPLLVDHTIICLSVCDAVHCRTQGQCRGWKLYHGVPRMALLIHFIRYCCCRMSATTHSYKLNHQNFRIWNSHGQHGYGPCLFQTRHFGHFGSAAIDFTAVSPKLWNNTPAGLMQTDINYEQFKWWLKPLFVYW